MENRFFGLTLTDIRRLSYEFAVINDIKHPFNKESEMTGEDIVSGFLKRHQTLSCRTPEARTAAKATVFFNKVVVEKFYRLLNSIYESNSFRQSRIFNCDETGIMAVPNKTSKIVSPKGKKQVSIPTTTERGTLITT